MPTTPTTDPPGGPRGGALHVVDAHDRAVPRSVLLREGHHRFSSGELLAPELAAGEEEDFQPLGLVLREACEGRIFAPRPPSAARHVHGVDHLPAELGKVHLAARRVLLLQVVERADARWRRRRRSPAEHAEHETLGSWRNNC